jgi:cbb3-type cytochrome oxidase maturation protein
VDVVYLLVPLSVLFLIGGIWGLLWAIRTGQFEDLDGPANRIIMDDREMRRHKRDE